MGNTKLFYTFLPKINWGLLAVEWKFWEVMYATGTTQ